MKTDSTSGPLMLSSKIRVVLSLVLTIFLMGSSSSLKLNPQINTKLLITADDLKSISLEQKVIIDTRSKIKFLMGHIPDAINLNNWEKFTSRKNGIKGILIDDKSFISDAFRSLGININQHIIIYGDPKNPWRTDGRFFWMFERYGFTNVSILDGGLKAWENIGGKVEKGFQKAKEVSKIMPEKFQLNSEVIADKFMIKNILNDKNYVLIDNRTKDEYKGSTPYGSPRGGHIPNAKHIHWPKFFKENGTLKSLMELSHLLENEEIYHEQEIVVYCTGGVRSAMAYFVFRYLGFKTRNYDGSWWDWSNDANLPVETSG